MPKAKIERTRSEASAPYSRKPKPDSRRPESPLALFLDFSSDDEAMPIHTTRCFVLVSYPEETYRDLIDSPNEATVKESLRKHLTVGSTREAIEEGRFLARPDQRLVIFELENSDIGFDFNEGEHNPSLHFDGSTIKSVNGRSFGREASEDISHLFSSMTLSDDSLRPHR